MSYKHSELTREIINAFYQVYNTLGYGFLEKVYQNALFSTLAQSHKLLAKSTKQLVTIRKNKKSAQIGVHLRYLRSIIILLTKFSRSTYDQHPQF